MKTWIKFYTESIHDRKLWKLKPLDQLTFFYLCALAGIEDRCGVLPSMDDIELELQMPLKMKRQELERTMSRLTDLGLLSKSQDNVWTVTNFEKRQMSAMTEAERKAIYRDKKRTQSGQKSDECPDNVRTDVQKMSHIEEEVEVEEEKEEEINTLTNVSVCAPEKKSDRKPEKRRYGSSLNVLLTDDEYCKLHERFIDADERIENLSLGIASKGYKYKDHYATILNWARRDAEKQPAQKQPETTFGDIRNYFEAVETPQWDIDL